MPCHDYRTFRRRQEIGVPCRSLFWQPLLFDYRQQCRRRRYLWLRKFRNGTQSLFQCMRSFLTLSDSQNYKYQSTFSTPGCELGKSIDFVVSSAMEWLRRPEHFVALFHYHTTQDQARAVLRYHLVKPEASEPLNFGEQWPTAVTPHVTLTSIPPEAGREK